MIGVWHEIKNLVKEEEQARQSMTPDDLTKSANKKNTEAFFHKLPPILNRWMKCQCIEEGNVISALVIDQMMKAIMIKLDQVLQIKNKQVTEAQEKAKETIANAQRIQLEQFLKHKIEHKVVNDELKKKMNEI